MSRRSNRRKLKSVGLTFEKPGGLKMLPPEGDAVATSLRRCVSEMDYSRVRMTGIPQETYRWLRANSLAGPWETLTNITTGVDGFGQFLDANPPGDKSFYRAVSP